LAVDGSILFTRTDSKETVSAADVSDAMDAPPHWRFFADSGVGSTLAPIGSNLALIMDGKLELHAPDRPTGASRLGSIELADSPDDMLAVGPFIVMCSSTTGLGIVDARDARRPALVGHYTEWPGRQLARSGRRLYMLGAGGHDALLHVFGLDDQGRPHELSVLSVGPTAGFLSAFGSVVHLLHGGGSNLYDASDPTDLRLASRVEDLRAGVIGASRLYAQRRRFSGLLAFDISDPYSPTVLDTLVAPPTGGYGPGLAVQDDRIYAFAYEAVGVFPAQGDERPPPAWLDLPEGPVHKDIATVPGALAVHSALWSDSSMVATYSLPDLEPLDEIRVKGKDLLERYYLLSDGPWLAFEAGRWSDRRIVVVDASDPAHLDLRTIVEWPFRPNAYSPALRVHLGVPHVIFADTTGLVDIACLEGGENEIVATYGEGTGFDYVAYRDGLVVAGDREVYDLHLIDWSDPASPSSVDRIEQGIYYLADAIPLANQLLVSRADYQLRSYPLVNGEFLPPIDMPCVFGYRMDLTGGVLRPYYTGTGLAEYVPDPELAPPFE